MRRPHGGQPGRRGRKQRTKASAAVHQRGAAPLLRERDAIVAAAQADPVARYNHPRWWIERLQADWPQQWQPVLQANNRHPPMTLRVNARRGTADALRPAPGRGGHRRARGARGPAGGAADKASAGAALPGFAEGDVSVQDAAAQLARRLLIGDGLPPARACSTPAPPRAARRPTCWSWPTSTCWRWTATPSA
jgi:16S rRNA (cytosine967-C5)-methyltransferase